MCPRVSEVLWKRKPFLLQERLRGRNREEGQKEKGGERQIWHEWEKHVRKCKYISASASVHVWTCSFIHLDNCLSAWVWAWVAQLFKEDTNWQWDLWFERREAVCLLFTVSKKKKLILEILSNLSTGKKLGKEKQRRMEWTHISLKL